jgi:uncharacterized heparinase superfamily protein
MTGGKMIMIMDVGNLPPVGENSHVLAGLLSFELSSGKDRLIVNCGTAPGHDVNWAQAQKATAAHSTLSIRDTNSTTLPEDKAHKKAEPHRLPPRRAYVTSDRSNDGNGRSWISARHDGYEKPYGLVHERKIYMHENGEDIRGEDILHGTTEHDYAIRFHIHPGVQVSVLHKTSSALLRLPNGEGWRLRTSGSNLTLTPSVYFGEERIRRTQQIVLSGVSDEGGDGATHIKWALQKETGK